MASHKVLTKIIITTITIVLLILPKSVSAVSFNVNSTITQSFWNSQMRSKWGGNAQSWSPIGTNNQTSCSANEGGNCLPVQMQFYDANEHISANTGDIYEIILGGRVKFSFGHWQNVGNSNWEVLDIQQQDTWSSETTDSNIRSASYSTTHIIVRAKSDSVWLELGNGTNNIFNLPFTATSTYNTQVVYFLLAINKLSIQSVVDADNFNEVNEKELEGQENIENQDTTGNDQGVSDDDYSSLLDIFTGFITAITNVKATNCNISLNTDMGNFGNVDLCEIDPPSYIQIVGSLIVILLFVPCSIALIKRILRTIQELQQ